MKLDEIEQKLKRGDKGRIAKIVGCTHGTVRAVLFGWRNPETELAKKVIKAAILVAEETEKLDLKIKEEITA